MRVRQTINRTLQSPLDNMASFLIVAVCLVWQISAILGDTTADAMPTNVSYFEIDSEPVSQAQIGSIKRSADVTGLITGTKFMLYNDKVTNLDITGGGDAIEKYMDRTKPIKFIIHGFIDATGVTWMHTMAAELVVKTQSTVIVVEWNSKHTFNYLLISNVVRKVAENIKEFISAHNIPPENTHIIGHSLGAHVAGFTGKSIASGHKTENISRITGLDPAWPGFFSKGPADRLHYTDADFVDVIHSSALSYSFTTPILGLPVNPKGLGLDEPIGHIDFYPNNGQKQPSCVISNLGLQFRRKRRGIITDPANALMESVFAFMTKYAACNHYRSIQLFTESIGRQFQSDCQFRSCHTDSYQQFKRYGCQDGEVNKMGYLATKPHHPPGFRYYLSTNGQPMYCNDAPTKIPHLTK